MQPTFCFRFDVDTHRCVRTGVPGLLELGRATETRFTFFVNMGRAVSLRSIVGRLGAGRRKGASAPEAAKLTAARKLGPVGVLTALFLNPRVGGGSPGVLRRVEAEGHEVGLHGGANHAVWQGEAAGWNRERVRGEVEAATEELTTTVGRRPRGFASPGWRTPPGLPSILAELGYRYLADRHGPGERRVDADEGPVATVRTGLTGEPGGVAYLEHLRARGLDDDAILADFRERLQDVDELGVVYDHPYWAGIRELELLERMIELVRREGFRVVTLEEAVQERETDAP